MIDTDLILDTLKKWVEEKKPISAETWMDAALKLTMLLEDEHDALIDLEQKVAQKKLDILDRQEKRNVAAAELTVEASEEYKAMRRQKMKVDRIEEMSRLAKKYASINEFK